MDPVTAFALSCNVLQLVESALKIVKVGLKLYRNAGQAAGISEYSDVQNVTSDLVRTNNRLEAFLRTEGPRKPEKLNVDELNSLTVGEDAEIRELCVQCNRIAQELLKKLNSYHVPEDRAVQGAVKVTWKLWRDGDELQSLNDRLQLYRSQLGTRLLVSIRDKVDRQSKDFERLYGRVGDIQDAIWDNRIFFQQSNEIQTEALRRHFDAHMQQLQQRFEQSGLLSSGRAGRSNSSVSLGLPPEYVELPGSPGFYGRPVSPGSVRARTPVMSIIEAVEANNIIEMRNIIRRNPSAVYEFDEETGMTALHIACRNDNYDAAMRLLKDGAKVNPDDNDGRLPLHHAAKGKNSKLVRLLLERGGDPRYPDNENNTPAKYAVPDTETAWILANGPSINARCKDGETALHLFSRLGDLKTVRSLLDQGAQVDVTDSFGGSPLHDAAGGGHTDVVALLFEHTANIESTDSEGRTALMLATLANKPETTRLLLSQGAKVNHIDSREHIALNDASEHGYVEVARALLAAGADVEHFDVWGYHPLGLAAREGHSDFVRLLLDHGADIEGLSTGGWTAIHEALGFNQPECVKALLEYKPNLDFRVWNEYPPLHTGIDKGSRDAVFALLDHCPDVPTELRRVSKDKWTALHVAAHHNRHRIVADLLKRGADPAPRAEHKGYIPLHLAAINGSFESVTAYLDSVPDASQVINLTNIDSWTALHEAAQHNRPRIISALLKRGADPALRTELERFTPLHMAAYNGNLETVTAYLSNVPEIARVINLSNIDAWTALHEAAHRGFTEIVRLLISHGADPHVLNKPGRYTPLLLAVMAGHAETVSLMLDLAEDQQAELDRGGWTPLHEAAFYGYTQMVADMIRRGAKPDVQARAEGGPTPLSLACSTTRSEAAARLLIEAGADVNAKTRQGRTPLDVCVEHGRHELARLLRRRGARESTEL